MEKTLLNWADGNPGALTFLMKLYMEEPLLINVLIIDTKLKKCESIRGTNLYVLWSDLADQNIDNVVEISQNVPDDVLEEACNRQDYSGRELIQEYVDFMVR